MPETRAGKRLFTANRVTAARLALLPLGTYLLYQGTGGQWIALVAMTIVGCTDFVDGWLARRHGPTVLGGLMDPIADKMFIALTMLPALDLGWFATLPVALIFFREFVITAARTAYSRRNVTLRTSYLAKIKTWYQMISVGLIFLQHTSPVGLIWVLTACAVLPIAGGLVYYAVRRKLWRGSVAFALSFGAFRLAAALLDQHGMELLIAWSTVLITWASGGAYLFGLRDLPGTARFDAHDAVRLVGAASLPVLACALIGRSDVPAWPVFTTVAVEFAMGGLDNLLAHQKRLGDWRGWGLRVGLQAALLGAALASAKTSGSGEVAFPLSLAALAITLVAALLYFWKYRQAYLDARHAAPADPGTSAGNARP